MDEVERGTYCPLCGIVGLRRRGNVLYCPGLDGSLGPDTSHTVRKLEGPSGEAEKPAKPPRRTVEREE